MTANGWRVCGLAVALGAIGAIGSLALPLAAALGLAGALAVAWLWSRLALSQIRADDLDVPTIVSVGATVQAAIRPTNNGPVPAAIAIDVRSTLPAGDRATTTAIGARAEARVDIAWPCPSRGAFVVGPVRIVAFDPFGLCHASRVNSARRRVVVVPRLEPVGDIPIGGPHGDGRPQGGVTENPPDARGVRDYEAGDPVSRIHWLSTARLGRLVVREIERASASSAIVLADLDRSVQVGVGHDGTEERIVSVAGSVATALLASRSTIGLAITANRHLDRAPGRSAEHSAAILEALAVARAGKTPPLADVLVESIGRLPRGAFLVVVTPSLDATWVDVLRRAEPRGIGALVCLIEPATFGPAPASLSIVTDLIGAGVPIALVKQDRALADALATA